MLVFHDSQLRKHLGFRFLLLAATCFAGVRLQQELRRSVLYITYKQPRRFTKGPQIGLKCAHKCLYSSF